MAESLFNRASKNFDAYLKEFQEKGNVYMLPRSRLNDEEWRMLNAELVKYGVCLVPATKNGASYMKFSALPKRNMAEKEIVRADSDFGAKLKRYTGLDWEHKTTSGLGYEHYRIKIDDMPQSQVQKILDILDKNAIYDASAIYTNKGQFLIVNAPDPVLDGVLDYYRVISFQKKPAYVYAKSGMGKATAKKYADAITQRGQHYATILNAVGHSGADHIVIAMKKSDAEKIGAEYNGSYLHLKRDNGLAKQKLSKMIGVPLTHINGVPVVIESKSDFGVCAGRPIVLVKVGNKKLPFYISSGSAGKTDVPVGKWEFFGGIDETGWFRKGTLDEILSHYHSPELKKIANALDDKIGDLRDTVDVLKTIGRKSLGGQGVVAKMLHGPEISISRINRDVFDTKNDGVFQFDLFEIKRYLHNLQSGNNVVKDMRRGTDRLQTKIFSRIASWLKDDKSNQ